MAVSSTCTFIDPDDYQAGLDRRPLHVLLVNDRGEFKARVTSARLDHLYLFRSEEDFPRIAYISLAPAVVFVGSAARGSRPMVWDSAELQPSEIVLHGRGERFHQRTAGSCSWGLIGLSPMQLERYSEVVIGKAVCAPPAARILRPAVRNSTRLLRLHAQACRLAESRPRILGSPEVARAVEQGIIHALMTCLRTTRGAGDGLARHHHRGIMMRFEEVLTEHLGQRLPMPELCKLVDVGDRTLRSCCTEFLGISPSRYVLLRRLKQARIALREADPAAASVAEIARACGFTQLGRFAGLYQAAFGEPPSATLRRLPGSGSISPIFAESAWPAKKAAV